MKVVSKKMCVILITMLLLIEGCALFLVYKSYSNKNTILDNVRLNEKLNKTNMFAILLEQEDGTYKEDTANTWPTGYRYNASKSGCIDVNGNKLDGVLSYDSTNNIATVDTGATSYCYLYFDKDKSVYAKVVSDYTNSNGVSKISSTSAETGDTYDAYYYTGNITNNNILYGGFCWKMVITTETNGVKLIYNGTPTTGTDSEGNTTYNCNNTGTASQLTKKAFNSSYNSLAYVGYMYNKVYAYNSKTMSSISDSYKYGNSFEDTNNDGVYELTNPIEFSEWSSNYNTLNNNHYTCFNTNGECTDLKYIYYTNNSTAYYITLTNGTTIEEAIDEMLYAEDVNTTDSTIKDYIDTWYEGNLLETKDANGVLYSKYLENAIFCANRAMISASSNGWNPNGGKTSTSIFFNHSSLECENKTDRFTLKAGEYGGTEGYGNNALDYPIGLISFTELSLAKETGYLKSGSNYWLLSPRTFSSNHRVEVSYVDSGGNLLYDPVYTAYGVRPSVSLSSSVEIVDGGDGTVTNPYEVKLSE